MILNATFCTTWWWCCVISHIRLSRLADCSPLGTICLLTPGPAYSGNVNNSWEYIIVGHDNLVTKKIRNQRQRNVNNTLKYVDGKREMKNCFKNSKHGRRCSVKHLSDTNGTCVNADGKITWRSRGDGRKWVRLQKQKAVGREKEKAGSGMRRKMSRQGPLDERNHWQPKEPLSGGSEHFNSAPQKFQESFEHSPPAYV